MYIGSTNLFLNLPEYNKKVSSNWIASEKYYNCDNLNYLLNMNPRKRIHLWKNKSSKKSD
jgi:hypothetical protein